HPRTLCGVNVLLPQLLQSDTILPIVPLDTPNISAIRLCNSSF
ncbi:2613_t:CDS:1, partial [Funneliformis geosporum]